MAKDPAILFYPADFIIATAFFSNEQVGKYIRLLCYQQQLGHLKESDMITVCGTIDDMIFSKFKKDENGLYYNPRMEDEKIKRSSFTKSRIKNLKSNSHMGVHMENENVNEDKNEKVKFMEFVFMTQGQYDQLAQKLGKTVLDEYVERLNNYIGSKGKNYKSHYHTILSWTNKDSPKKTEGKPKKANPNCWVCNGLGKMKGGSDCNCLK